MIIFFNLLVRCHRKISVRTPGTKVAYKKPSFMFLSYLQHSFKLDGIRQPRSQSILITLLLCPNGSGAKRPGDEDRDREKEFLKFVYQKLAAVSKFLTMVFVRSKNAAYTNADKEITTDLTLIKDV